ncbi:MAG: ATP-binding cassette domain-containing protein, partial [Rhodospirillales bacterium]|nr:ATP-binding cassette domain-containing protein [Rhodospirillales bacterium]
GLNDDALGWPVSRLSTGEKQRLALIRALIQNPQVLLLDEPTSALDPDSRTMVEDLLAERIAAGLSVLIVSHDAAQTKRLGARIYLIDGGRLVDNGGTT